jgi:hypothetical protein
LGGRQVDLVEDRDDLEPRVDREVEVRERLRLDPLRRIDQQQDPVARRKRARHLVAEVDMAGRVDEVELVGHAVLGDVLHAHGRGLDRDPTLALEIHSIQELRAHVTVGDGVGELQNPVGERALTVVYVADDGEGTLMRLIHWWARA